MTSSVLVPMLPVEPSTATRLMLEGIQRLREIRETTDCAGVPVVVGRIAAISLYRWSSDRRAAF
jgi:hypothetical protein